MTVQAGLCRTWSETQFVCFLARRLKCLSPVVTNKYLSRLVRKPTVCICENKDADQLRGTREADQRLCFRYWDSTIPLLLKYEISSFELFSVLVQASLCRTCSETTLLVFPRDGSFAGHTALGLQVKCYLVRYASITLTASHQRH